MAAMEEVSGSGTDMDASSAVTSMRCRFITTADDIRVPTDALSLPVRLGRKGLSEVINHLVGGGRAVNTTFDFLVYDNTLATSSGGNDTTASSTETAAPTRVEEETLDAAFLQRTPKRLLRRSLRAHVAEHGLSTERLLTIEYVPSLPRPADGGRVALPDWVGSMAGLAASHFFPSQREAAATLDGHPCACFVAGCYDGTVRLVDDGGSLLADVAAHDGPVKAVAAAGDLVVTGGMDKVVRSWRASYAARSSPSSGSWSLAPAGVAGLGSGGERASRAAQHEASVDCAAVSLDHPEREGSGGLALTGDWAGRLCLWRVPGSKAYQEERAKRRMRKQNSGTTAMDGSGEDSDEEEEEEEEEEEKVSLKKQRRSSSSSSSSSLSSLVPLTSQAAWKAHAQCVSGVAWMGGRPLEGGGVGSGTMAVTSSWDHSIKTWDAERQDCVVTINASHVNTCLAAPRSSSGEGSMQNLVAVGHADGRVRLWDLRANPGNNGNGNGGSSAAAAGTLRPAASGAEWISGVAFGGDEAPHLVASSSHDGGVRIYDRRGGTMSGAAAGASASSCGPIFTLRAHGTKAMPEKGLCVSWTGGIIASGGADCHVRTYRVNK